MLSFKQALIGSTPKSFVSGLSVLSGGFHHCLKNKKLLFLAVLPIVIAVLCISFFYSPLYTLVYKFLEHRVISTDGFDFWGGAALLWIVKLLIKVLSAVASFVCFYILLQVVYIPFCSLLAEAVLRGKGIVQIQGVSGMLSYNFSMFKVGLLKAVLLVFIGFVLFVTSFLPLLSFLPLYFALMVLAYDSFDYGLELYGFNLNQRSTFARKEFFMLNGHAGVLFALSFLPGLLLLTLPFSVVGASLKLGEVYDIKRTVA